MSLEPGGQRVLARESLFADLGERIRDVKQAGDGAVILLADAGKIYRIGAV